MQRQVPAVHVVRELGGAPVPVHRQGGGVFPQCKLCRRPA